MRAVPVLGQGEQKAAAPIQTIALSRHGYVAFSPDGKRAASASFDNKITVWNIYKREVECTFTAGQDGTGKPIVPRVVAFSPDGRILASGAKPAVIS
jgi:WD40 repeat protein